MTAEEEDNATIEEAEELAIEIMRVCGMHFDGRKFEGRISKALVSGALMLCAGRILSAVDDAKANVWIEGVQGLRLLTRAQKSLED